LIIVRLLLGAIFLFSSSGKIADPEGLCGNCDQLPVASAAAGFSNSRHISLDRGGAGLALVFGRFEKGAALLVSLMMIVFTGLILYNGYRGLNIACGCFSLAAKAPSNIAVNTMRNLLFWQPGYGSFFSRDAGG
jgi:uncharacterized membrane protein YphA (DoxX/SURF4 family)